MKKNIVLIISLLCFFVAADILSAQSLVTIRGTIKNAKSQIASVDIFENPLSEEIKSYAGMVKPDGSFVIQLELSKPVMGTFFHNNLTSPVFIEPGDDMTVYVDANHFSTTLKFAGKGSERNNYIREYRLKFETRQEMLKDQSKIRSLSAQAYRDYLNNRRRDKKDFFNQWRAKATDFSSAFESFAEGMIDYPWALKVIDMPFAYSLERNQDIPDFCPRLL